MEIDSITTDEAIREGLAQAGSPIDRLAAELAGPIGIPQLDAVASEICRMLGESTVELARYIEAENAEIARIQMRYRALRDPVTDHILRLEAIGKEVASRSDFGKRKSRKVGFGMYGRRTVPERLSVVDQDAALEWLTVNAQGSLAIREQIKRSVDLKEAKPVVLSHLKATGEVAPGFDHAEAREEPFIKPGE